MRLNMIDQDRVNALTAKLFKLAKKLKDEFSDLDTLSEEDLRAKLLSCAQNMEAVLLERDSDEKLQQAKEELKELRAPYAESLARLRLLSAFCSTKLALLGEDLGGEDPSTPESES